MVRTSRTLCREKKVSYIIQAMNEISPAQILASWEVTEIPKVLFGEVKTRSSRLDAYKNLQTQLGSSGDNIFVDADDQEQTPLPIPNDEIATSNLPSERRKRGRHRKILSSGDLETQRREAEDIANLRHRLRGMTRKSREQYKSAKELHIDILWNTAAQLIKLDSLNIVMKEMMSNDYFFIGKLLNFQRAFISYFGVFYAVLWTYCNTFSPLEIFLALWHFLFRHTNISGTKINIFLINICTGPTLIKKTLNFGGSVVNSTTGVRQGSSLSTLYFCTFFQPLLETMAHEFPELYIYAYIDDVNFASKDLALISTAFQRFKVLLQEKRIELSCQKCVWFTGKNDIAMPDTLECQGTSTEAEAAKFLGAFVGENQSVSSKLVQQLEKHDTIFRRLEAMGANNIFFFRLFVKRGGCFQLRSHSCYALRVENHHSV